MTFEIIKKPYFKTFFVGLLIIGLVLLQIELGQDKNCGTLVSKEQVKYELEHNITYSEKLSPLDYHTILPINVIIFENEDGKVAAFDEQINQTINQLTAAFAPINIQFEICNTFFVKDENLFNYKKADEEQLLKYTKKGYINLFFVNKLTLDEPGNACGYTYFPLQQKDIIVIRGACCEVGYSSLIHEMGHFFGLYHTHERVFGVELANGDNCHKAGDLICDTPADPGLTAMMLDENCNYTGSSKDKNNNIYQPDESNFMSYGKNNCRTHFTKDQFNKMVYNFCNFKTHLKQLDIQYGISDTLIFPDMPVTIYARGGQNYRWSTGDTLSHITVKPLTDTIISLYLMRPGYCTIKRKFKIHIIPDSYLSLNGDNICKGEKAIVNVNKTKLGVNYQLRQNGKLVGEIIKGNGATISLTSTGVFEKTLFSVTTCDSVQNCDYVLTDKRWVNVLPDFKAKIKYTHRWFSTPSLPDSALQLNISGLQKNTLYRVITKSGKRLTSSKHATNDKLIFRFRTKAEIVNKGIQIEAISSCNKKKFYIIQFKEFKVDSLSEFNSKL